MESDQNDMNRLTILDCNNFWSPTGGGVRRYHLQKLKYFDGLEGIRHIFVMPDRYTATEQYGAHSFIEHLKAVKQPGAGEYRYIFNTRALRRFVDKYRPDVIEIGSPYFLPWLIRPVLSGLTSRPALVGFWHNDFPRTQVGRTLRSWPHPIRVSGEKAAWWWARKAYAPFDAVFVASRRVGEYMMQHGFSRLYYTPLGVDTDLYHPDHRDASLNERLKAGHPDRLILFFPHRLSDEKGLGVILAAYPKLVEMLPYPPALVFAGVGPRQNDVEKAARRFPHVHYIGYIDRPHDFARWYASCDLAVALSAFETFGLSAAEAMASGLALVGADENGSAELIESSGCGLTIPYGDIDALVSAIGRLVEEKKLKERGMRGRNYVSRFTWENTFNTEIACYHDIIRAIHDGKSIRKEFHNLTQVDTG